MPARTSTSRESTAQALGRVEGELVGVKSAVTQLQEDVRGVRTDVQTLNAALAENRGSSKTLWSVGSIAATVSAAVVTGLNWLVTRL